jgi:hypothetical protein
MSIYFKRSVLLLPDIKIIYFFRSLNVTLLHSKPELNVSRRTQLSFILKWTYALRPDKFFVLSRNTGFRLPVSSRNLFSTPQLNVVLPASLKRPEPEGGNSLPINSEVKRCLLLALIAWCWFRRWEISAFLRIVYFHCSRISWYKIASFSLISPSSSCCNVRQRQLDNESLPIS